MPATTRTARVPERLARAARGPWGTAVAAWTAARICVATAFVLSDLVANYLRAPAARRLHLDQGLITWDGTFYWHIAHGGYGSLPREALRFFPLYPLAARVLSWPLGGHEGIPLLVISNGAALASLVLLHRLVVEEVGDRALARRSMWVLALFPAAGVFAFAYTESLALALTLGAILLARHRHWGWAALLALGCGLMRPVGVLVALPLLYEAWQQYRTGRERPRAALVVGALAAPVAGLVGFLVWVDRDYGSWRIPLDEQRRLRHGFQDPVSRIWDAVHLTVTSSRHDVFNLAFTVLFVVLLVIAVRTQHWGWWTFALANMAVALSSPVIDSTGRYGLVVFPLFVALAVPLRRREVELAWLVVSAGALVAITTLALVGNVVP
jgi:hypothetical protein